MSDHSHHTYRFEASALETLFLALRADGYRIVGPRQRGEVILYDDISSASDLPIGIGDAQEAGTYRLQERGDRRYFGFNVGPDSWRKFLRPKRQLLWRAKREGDKINFQEGTVDGAGSKIAFLGVRACDLAAIAIQNRVHQSCDTAPEVRPFVIAVHCATAAATCFCHSMGTGPEATSGFDLALAEIANETEHYFLVTAATDDGQKVLARLPTRIAQNGELAVQSSQKEDVIRAQTREIVLDDPAEFFRAHLNDSHWEKVANRCLSCANCTLVCPTCFCTTVEDATDLQGEVAERWLRWDSCFNHDFSYIHGGAVRESTASRYRQWISHKLGTWHEQFGTSGCVGCGRCVAWCPVGIDLTEEVKALKQGADL